MYVTPIHVPVRAYEIFGSDIFQFPKQLHIKGSENGILVRQHAQHRGPEGYAINFLFSGFDGIRGQFDSKIDNKTSFEVFLMTKKA